MLGRLQRFLALSPPDRRRALRRRTDFFVGAAIFGGPAARINRAQRYAYLSYLPDSIRENKKLPGLRDSIDAWTNCNKRRNAGDMSRMLTLLFNADKVIADGVSGDFAEVGVYRGNSAKLLASLLADKRSSRNLHLFDTFGGFDVRDLTGLDAHRPALFADVAVDQVRKFVGQEHLCRYWVGYFPDSAQDMQSDSMFAFVHLDLDLYAPMKAGLEFFYPRMPRGATMVLHDYFSGHWPGATAAVDEFLSDKPESVVLMPDKSGTAIFRKL
jgi:hypothetical protein